MKKKNSSIFVLIILCAYMFVALTYLGIVVLTSQLHPPTSLGRIIILLFFLLIGCFIRQVRAPTSFTSLLANLTLLCQTMTGPAQHNISQQKKD
jgi:O-antigen ligase